MHHSLRPFEAHALPFQMVCCSAGGAGLHTDFKTSKTAHVPARRDTAKQHSKMLLTSDTTTGWMWCFNQQFL